MLKYNDFPSSGSGWLDFWILRVYEAVFSISHTATFDLSGKGTGIDKGDDHGQTSPSN